MATRFYFPASEAAAVSPSLDGGWEFTDSVVYRRTTTTKGTSAIAAGTQHSWTAGAGNQQCDRVYVSDPIAAQTLSPSGAWTWKGQLMVREYATSDDVDRLVSCLKVVSGDGTTVRGTLSAILHRGPTGEFVNNATHRNKQIADGDALSQVVAQDGDRIVIEIGYESSTGGTSPEASAKWGENATDLPENASQTTDGAGWFELSGDVQFLRDVDLDKSIGDFTLDADAAVEVQASLSQSIGNFTLDGDVTVDVQLAVTQSIGTFTLDADLTVEEGVEERQVALSQPIGSFILDADVAVEAAVALNKSIGDFTLDADATVEVQAALNRSIGDFVLDGDVAVEVQTTLAKSIGAFGLDADLGVEVAVTLSRSIGDLTLDSDLTVDVAAALNRSIGDFLLDADLTLLDLAELQLSLSGSIGAFALSAALSAVVELPPPELAPILLSPVVEVRRGLFTTPIPRAELVCSRAPSELVNTKPPGGLV